MPTTGIIKLPPTNATSWPQPTTGRPVLLPANRFRRNGATGRRLRLGRTTPPQGHQNAPGGRFRPKLRHVGNIPQSDDPRPRSKRTTWQRLNSLTVNSSAKTATQPGTRTNARPSGTERRTFTFRVILRSNNIHRSPKTGGPKTDQSRKHAAKRKRGHDVSRYQTRKERGLCRSCPNEAILGQTRCPSCAETHRQSANARNVHKREERNQEGLCHDCKAKAAPGSTRCSQCAEEHRQRQRRYSRNPNRSRRTADTATKLVQTDLWGKPIRT